MSDSPVRYQLDGEVATITMDDGKRNALSPTMFVALNDAIDHAERDGAMILLTGRTDTFSAGFDLKVLGSGGTAAVGMLKSGFAMTERLLSFPRPVITASTGHAMAMGLFLLLSSDYRLGITGAYKYTANEVAIGLPMPRVAAEVLRLRLTPAQFHRAATLAAMYTPEEALAAGMLDELVSSDKLLEQARAAAAQFAQLDKRAHHITKLRLREKTLSAIRRGLPLDLGDALVTGVRRFMAAKKSKSAWKMAAGRSNPLAFAFLFIGFSAIAVGLLLVYIGIPVVWLGINSIAVGVNYLFPQRLNLFGKTNGRVSLARKMLLLPFFVLLYSAWHVLRKVSREAPFAELIPGVFIGRRLLPGEYPPVSTLVDLTAELDEHIPTGANLLAFPLLDGAPAEPTQLRNMARMIVASAKPVYIHCAQGHGRTSMVAAAVLIEMGAAKSVDEALQMIRAVRPYAKPKGIQYAALIKAFV